MLLHYAGTAVEDIFDTLPNTGTEDELKPALNALNVYFTSKKNVVYETIIFREAPQESHENVEMFATRLRKLAVNCDFADPEKEIQVQIVAKCRSSQLKKRVLEKDRSLSNLLELARTLELSDTKGRDVAALQSKQVNKIQTARARREHIPTKNSHNKNTHKKQCYKCDLDYPHEDDCPELGKKCLSYEKMNHFARCCRQSPLTSARREDNRSIMKSHTERKPKEKVKGVQQQQKETDRNTDTDDHHDHDENYVFAVSLEDTHKDEKVQKLHNDENVQQWHTDGKVQNMHTEKKVQKLHNDDNVQQLHTDEKAMTHELIQEETEKDKSLQDVIQCYKTNQWH